MAMPDDPQQQENPFKQCNVQLPTDLVIELRAEACLLTGHRRRGFSDLLAIFAHYGWEAYQRGDLTIEREPRIVSYRLVKGES